MLIAVDNGRPQVYFYVCVGLPVQMHAEQIEVGGHFVSLSRTPTIYLVLIKKSGLIFTWSPFNTQIGMSTVLFNL